MQAVNTVEILVASARALANVKGPPHRKAVRRKAVIVGTIVTLVVSGLLGLLWSQQRRLIYFPSGGPVPPAA